MWKGHIYEDQRVQIFDCRLWYARQRNDNIDVSVTLENGEEFTVVIATVKNIEQQIRNEGKGYLPPGCPQIIVDLLSEDIVNQALSEFADSDAHWLKFHHCSDIISTEDLENIYKEFYGCMMRDTDAAD